MFIKHISRKMKSESKNGKRICEYDQMCTEKINNKNTQILFQTVTRTLGLKLISLIRENILIG